MADIPEETKERLARTAAEFKVKYDVEQDDIEDFMMDIIQIYEDYMREGIKEGRWKDK